ncbi:MAG: hypothetical protein H7259_01160 [Cytophagales bacterium]|nr:hypothetical protein [Cytophaga sp.]
MDLQQAMHLLDQSFIDLYTRLYRVNLYQVEEDVIYNACLSIFRDNTRNEAPAYAAAFTDAARALVSIYTEKEAAIAIRDIQKHVQWDGMWNFLKGYFREAHAMYIGDISY